MKLIFTINIFADKTHSQIKNPEIVIVAYKIIVDYIMPKKLGNTARSAKFVSYSPKTLY